MLTLVLLLAALALWAAGLERLWTRAARRGRPLPSVRLPRWGRVLHPIYLMWRIKWLASLGAVGAGLLTLGMLLGRL